MNLNKDPESWARVDPRAVTNGSQAQSENVLRMALQDIGRMSIQIKRLERKLQLTQTERNGVNNG